MSLSRNDAVERTRKEFLPKFRDEAARLDKIDLWYRWTQEDLTAPRHATLEHKALLELSKTPWLNLVVTNVAQSLYVDGYRSTDDPENARPWDLWQANDLDNRQIAVHRAALAYGYAYMKVLPGTNEFGEQLPVIRGVSPRKSIAFFDDIVHDDFPLYALEVRVENDASVVFDRDQPEQKLILKLYDDMYIHVMETSSQFSDEINYIETQVHGVGVCPWVMFANMLDLDGRTTGEVEPFIPMAKRINKTTFDRLLTQHYNSWKVRTISGMVQPDEDETQIRQALQLRQQELLISDNPDTKFGSLDETPLDGFLKAYTTDIETLAAVTQIPTHTLTGKMINLSAEALAAARASLDQKIVERKKAFGKSHEQVLKLGSRINGDLESARDITARITWADSEIRSMSQAVDALGKAAQMLMIPPQALWSRIPGITESDVNEWKKLLLSDDPITRYINELNAQKGTYVGSTSNGDLSSESSDSPEPGTI